MAFIISVLLFAVAVPFFWSIRDNYDDSTTPPDAM